MDWRESVADEVNNLNQRIEQLERCKAHITRAEAVRLIERQFERDSPTLEKKLGGQFRYGKQELRELLDAIYGGPPQSADQYLKGGPIEGKNGDIDDDDW